MSNNSVSEASVAWRNVEGTPWRISIEPPSSLIGKGRCTVNIKQNVIHFTVADRMLGHSVFDESIDHENDVQCNAVQWGVQNSTVKLMPSLVIPLEC